MVANPKPMLLAVEPHDHAGTFTANDHFNQMERNYNKFIRENPGKSVALLMTDCEATMIAAKKQYHQNHPEQSCPGCGIHCMHNHISYVFTHICVYVNNTKHRKGCF